MDSGSTGMGGIGLGSSGSKSPVSSASPPMLRAPGQFSSSTSSSAAQSDQWKRQSAFFRGPPMKNVIQAIEAHSEILAPGVKGINFMKPDAPVNTHSAVYQAVLEEEEAKSKGSAPSPSSLLPQEKQYHEVLRQTSSSPSIQSSAFKRLQVALDGVQIGGATSAITGVPNTNPSPSRPVEPVPFSPRPSNEAQGQLGNLCYLCGKTITGVFCRVNDKNLHPECFKCSTCGNSLKNVGHFNVDDKFYCDVHAQQASRVSGKVAPPTFPKPSAGLPFPNLPNSNPSPTSGMPLNSVPAPWTGGGSIGGGFGGGSSFKAAGQFPSSNASSLSPSFSPPKGPSNVAGSRLAPRRGRGQLRPSATPGTRIPVCAACQVPIRGPFIVALGKSWCVDHFNCSNSQCRRSLQDVGFVEEQGQLYCEKCFEVYLAPPCAKCNIRVKEDCLLALDRHWHPQCFVCSYCKHPFGNNSFYIEDGQPYCEKDWNELFTTKCVSCGFPIEAGDRWVEALNNNYHSQCFKCTVCHKNLEGQSFFAKGGRPFCKSHAR